MGFTTVTQLMSCRYCVSLKYQTSPRLRFTMGSEVIAGTLHGLWMGFLNSIPVEAVNPIPSGQLT